MTRRIYQVKQKHRDKEHEPAQCLDRWAFKTVGTVRYLRPIYVRIQNLQFILFQLAWLIVSEVDKQAVFSELDSYSVFILVLSLEKIWTYIT